MSNRNASENSDSISLFPFLAVLLCTMGALLVLLVVLVQRAAQEGLIAKISQLTLISATEPTQENREQREQLEQELADIAEYQQQLESLREQANKRLQDEQLRLSHSEEHARRLEEELARLAIAAAQLQQTEENQSVDQEQAEREVARLEKLVADTQQHVEELRAQSGGKHSYAIVPYKGPNGTYRRPIYIECNSEGITLHPEGIRLTANDFIAPHWPGNPLAAALRASREYLNNKATKGGDFAPPDPYPLMIVRPDGIKQYALARAAITSWDSDYGYEFIDEDMQLSFPEAADPQLAHAQQHAVIIARDRLLQLAQAAPSRFRGMGVGGGMTAASGEGDVPGGHGYGSSGSTSTEEDRYLAANQPGEGSPASMGTNAGSGDSSQEGQPGQADHLATGEPSSAGGDYHADGSTALAGSETNDTGNSLQQSTDKNLVGSRYAQASDEPGGKQGQAGTNQHANSGQQAGGGGAEGSGQASASGGTPTISMSNKPSESIAASQGANWAVDRAGQHAVPIRRSIRVVVRDNQMALLPTKNATRGAEANGQVISLDQPVNDISREFVSALRERIEEWGLAGNGMYWRPVLELNVGPDAQLTASRVVHLLQDSGVDIQLPETAANPVTPAQGEGVRR